MMAAIKKITHMKTLTTSQLDFLKSELAKLKCEHIDLPYFADENTLSYDDLRNAIDSGNGFDIEIIYYSKAIAYLSENDNSLRNSLQLAADMGYSCENLNSEILASLLATEQAREDFGQLESEIDAIFEQIEAMQEETEETI